MNLVTSEKEIAKIVCLQDTKHTGGRDVNAKLFVEGCRGFSEERERVIHDKLYNAFFVLSWLSLRNREVVFSFLQTSPVSS